MSSNTHQEEIPQELEAEWIGMIGYKYPEHKNNQPFRVGYLQCLKDQYLKQTASTQPVQEDRMALLEKVWDKNRVLHQWSGSLKEVEFKYETLQQWLSEDPEAASLISKLFQSK